MSFDPEQTHVRPFVHKTRKMKSLHFSLAEVQSSMDLAQPDSLDLAYTRTMMGFLLFHPQPRPEPYLLHSEVCHRKRQFFFQFFIFFL